jgi:hypothetical protein
MDAQYVIDGLVRRGMSPIHAEAFAWNVGDESGFDPGINELAPIVPGSRGGFGFSQWTGPRRRALDAYAANRGVPVSDPEMQLDFLMTELQGPEASAWQRISAAQTTPEAAAAVVNHFLRPAEEHRARREAEYLGGKVPTYSSGGNALAANTQIGGFPMPGQGWPQQPANQLARPTMADFGVNFGPVEYTNRLRPLDRSALQPIMGATYGA